MAFRTLGNIFGGGGLGGLGGGGVVGFGGLGSPLFGRNTQPQQRYGFGGQATPQPSQAMAQPQQPIKPSSSFPATPPMPAMSGGPGYALPAATQPVGYAPGVLERIMYNNSVPAGCGLESTQFSTNAAIRRRQIAEEKAKYDAYLMSKGLNPADYPYERFGPGSSHILGTRTL